MNAALIKQITQEEAEKALRREKNRKAQAIRTNKWKPNPGNTWNPLERFPRNNPCFCGSKLKAKKCCLNKIQAWCTAEEARKIEMKWEEILSGEFKIILEEGKK